MKEMDHDSGGKGKSRWYDWEKPRADCGTSNQAVSQLEDNGADLREMKCRRQRLVQHLWELTCKGSVRNVVGFTFFKTLMKEREPVEDA